MGKAPSIIFIARHGARLDAEDKSWQLTSPAPYDTPLSYGGWTQTRALGARIASILHERDLSTDEEDNSRRRRASVQDGSDVPSTQPSPSKKRKRKVVIHSSPFLRCIQSSVAISAGMAQYQGNLKKFDDSRKRTTRPTSKLGPPTRSLTLDSSAMDAKYSNAEPAFESPPSPQTEHQEDTYPDTRPTIRIDACLGEWLTTEYFEHIKPPPSSQLMIDGAKEGLMRAATPIQGVLLPVKNPGNAPNVDRSGVAKKSTVRFDLSGFSSSLPPLTEGSTAEGGADAKDYAYTSADLPRPRRKSLIEGYTPPMPTYAISSSESIPPGYVAHARDSCTRIDTHWDSMLEPQGWGDGGEYGEEWRSMHARFRKCLMEMITWYKNNDPNYDPQDSDHAPDETAEESRDEDVVVVLVTHGAGCNALIGALTNQPVLLDVGMASLTMAARKDDNTSFTLPPPRRMAASPSRHGRRSSVDCTQAGEYDMKFIASMDHLRAGSDPLKIPQLASPRSLAAIPENRRNNSSYSGSDGTRTPDLPPLSHNAALGSIRRSRATTSTATSRSSGTSPPHSSSGLWGHPSPLVLEASDSSQTHTSWLNSKSDDTAPDQAVIDSPVEAFSSQLPLKEKQGAGLWGSAPKALPPQRRWTVMERT